MAFESPSDLSGFFDENDFAGQAKITSEETKRTILVSGIFDNDFLSVSGGEVQINSAGPAFTAQSSELTTIKTGDALIYEGVTYKIRRVEPDGTGISNIILNKV